MRMSVLTFFVTLITGSATLGHAGLNQTSVKDLESTCSIIDRPMMVEKLGAKDLVDDSAMRMEMDGPLYIGIRFYALRECGLFASIGFQVDDILLMVEDTDVNSPAGAMTFFSYLKGEQAFSVTVLRRGRTIHFEIK